MPELKWDPKDPEGNREWSFKETVIMLFFRCHGFNNKPVAELMAELCGKKERKLDSLSYKTRHDNRKEVEAGRLAFYDTKTKAYAQNRTIEYLTRLVKNHTGKSDDGARAELDRLTTLTPAQATKLYHNKSAAFDKLPIRLRSLVPAATVTGLGVPSTESRLATTSRAQPSLSSDMSSVTAGFQSATISAPATPGNLIGGNTDWLDQPYPLDAPWDDVPTWRTSASPESEAPRQSSYGLVPPRSTEGQHKRTHEKSSQESLGRDQRRRLESPQGSMEAEDKFLAQMWATGVSWDRVDRDQLLPNRLPGEACERWARDLGHLDKFKWAWEARDKLNQEIRPSGKTGWTHLELEELGYWRAQGLRWSQIAKKFRNPHSEGSTMAYYSKTMQLDKQKWGWVEKIRAEKLGKK